MLVIMIHLAFSAHVLPETSGDAPVPFPHFPDRVHAFVWRNWDLVPVERMAEVLGTTPDNVCEIGHRMGLVGSPNIPKEIQDRAYITVIRRNWHLLPFAQLTQLLGWTDEQLAYTLREDDFLYIKLGSKKPLCEPLRYSPPNETVMQRAERIATVLRESFPDGLGAPDEALFSFVEDLSSPVHRDSSTFETRPNLFSPRFCYSYFALYGDPLLQENIDPYPDGLLTRLSASGVSGVWMHAVLSKLAPFPWDPKISENYEQRLVRLRELVLRLKRHGMALYLYMNEPRTMPLPFFEKFPELQGVTEGDYATLCTSVPEVQQYLVDSVATICGRVPELGGFFTITASENLTNCWSHHRGMECPRCGKRNPWEVIAEVNALIKRGIDAAGSSAQLIAWDWGWQNDWAPDAIRALPDGVAFMSVSEWDLPITRDGVANTVGEYSLSAIGPGPRAKRHWAVARARGLKTIAKIQAGTTWELGAVPYIPAVFNTAEHAVNLRELGVDGLMLGWTLGGYPSPNLDVVAEIGSDKSVGTEDAVSRVSERRFGEELAPNIVEAWRKASFAFREFPFHIGVVYLAPLQSGPANLLWEKPTGYSATMCGIAYDDLDAWHTGYPAEIFAEQLEKVSQGFAEAAQGLRVALNNRTDTNPLHVKYAEQEMGLMEAVSVHYRSVANQTRFVLTRRALAEADSRETALPLIDRLEQILNDELQLAKQLYALQTRDSRIGFEATNHYFYVPADLVEKILNCRDLLERWLPLERARF